MSSHDFPVNSKGKRCCARAAPAAGTPPTRRVAELDRPILAHLPDLGGRELFETVGFEQADHLAE